MLLSPFRVLLRPLTIALLLAAMLCGAGRPDAAEDLILPSDLAIGEPQSYELLNSVENTGSGIGVLVMSWHARFTVTLLEQDDKGFVFAWRYDRAALIDAIPQIRTAMEQAVAGLEGLEIRIRVGRDMTVEGIENPGRVGAVHGRWVAIMAQRMEYFGRSREEIEHYRAVYSSPEVMAQDVLRDPRAFFAPIGRRLPLGGSLAYEGRLVSPLDFAWLPSRGRIEVQRIDAARDLAWVVWSERIDQDKAAGILRASFEAYYAAVGQPLPEPLDRPRVEAVETAFATIDSASGWPVTIDFEGHRQIDQGTTINRIEIRRVEDR